MDLAFLSSRLRRRRPHYLPHRPSKLDRAQAFRNHLTEHDCFARPDSEEPTSREAAH
jgi:hypothetical protein